MPKDNSYKPAEIRKIMKVSPKLPVADRNKALAKIAKELGRVFTGVEQRWLRSNREKDEKKAAKKKVQVATSNFVHGPAPKDPPVTQAAPGVVTPMKFKCIVLNGARKWITNEEEQAMQLGLDNAIKDGSLSVQKSLIIPSHLVNRAKIYLAEKYNKNVFRYHSFPKDHKDKDEAKTSKIIVQRS